MTELFISLLFIFVFTFGLLTGIKSVNWVSRPGDNEEEIKKNAGITWK